MPTEYTTHKMGLLRWELGKAFCERIALMLSLVRLNIFLEVHKQKYNKLQVYIPRAFLWKPERLYENVGL